MVRAIFLSALVAALALVAAGCGGGDDSSSSADPTAAWASDFCGAVTTWKNDLQDTTSQFSDPSNLSQDNLHSAATDVQDSTQTFVNTLKGLGKPPTDSGQKVQSSVDELSTTLDEQSKTIADTANSVTSITSLPTAITTISTSLSAMGIAFSHTLQTLQDADVNGELKTAFDNSPDCADLTSS
jgi:methyl-accepting chemotaxis protein